MAHPEKPATSNGAISRQLLAFSRQVSAFSFGLRGNRIFREFVGGSLRADG
jgi:hypothetical protein